MADVPNADAIMFDTSIEFLDRRAMPHLRLVTLGIRVDGDRVVLINPYEADLSTTVPIANVQSITLVPRRAGEIAET